MFPLALDTAMFPFLGALELAFVLRGLCRRDGAFGLVVFGRELRNAPLTSSSGSCALTIKRPQARAITVKPSIKLFDLILKLLQGIRHHLCSIRTLKTTDAPSWPFCGTFTETNGDAPVLMTSVPTEFALNRARR